ncbi:hypothetical protein M569_13774 [Genlisea aurea]|uniref:DYW domain-containing protein n=1 Tax=Genlisea aurea TaxID=192259 RepID=S8C9J6_9LAMI|nr:hypothetical protein M569_13774 [Genlisea aurea]
MLIKDHVFPINHYLRILDGGIASKSLKVGGIILQCLFKFIGDSIGTTTPVFNKLIHLYISCHRPRFAHRIFRLIPIQQRKWESILCNKIIREYARHGPFQNAVDLYGEMLVDGVLSTKYTYPYVLKACSALQDVETGLKVHARVEKLNLKDDVFVCTALIDFYVKCGFLLMAQELFDEMPEKDTVTWNALISGVSLHGTCFEVIKLLSEMQHCGEKVNSSTLAAILPAIASECRLQEGKAIHGFGLRRCFHFDEVTATCLLDMYGKCGKLTYAMKIFEALHSKNEITWSAVIGACVTQNAIFEALDLFRRMMRYADLCPSPIMISTLLRGCAKLNCLNVGYQLHCYTMKLGLGSDLMVANTTLSLYAKCGSVRDAMRVLYGMQVIDSVSCSAIMSGCVQNGSADEALRIFRRMLFLGLKPELPTMMGFLPACSYLSALQHGVCGHAYCVVHGFTSDVSICNALVDMYSKCGNTDVARLVFDGISRKDVVSWNAMILGYGINGLGNEAISLFEAMNASSGGVKPDGVTFVALLSACSHSGLVAEGRRFFRAMAREFDVAPKTDHYFCMADLLGRTGFLSEARDLIGSMPFEPDAHMWNALLASCRIHRDVEMAEEVSGRILSAGPAGTGNFVLLHNLYTTAERWKDAAAVRVRQREMGFRKRPGCSWIEVSGTVHGFVGGRSGGYPPEIYAEVERLSREMKGLGYRAECGYVYQDVEEEEKEGTLLYHGEKLAVAFGVLRVGGDKRIVVSKNLRVCGDCHEAIKYVTVITKREISVRDTTRFHHFKDGVCNCGDFW